MRTVALDSSELVPRTAARPESAMVKAIACVCRPPGPAAITPARFARPSSQGGGELARRARAAQCPASRSARVRASEQMASWCLRIGMAMKLCPSSSSSRCCGVTLTALSLPNPSKK
jgi:hypothetical protein